MIRVRTLALALAPAVLFGIYTRWPALAFVAWFTLVPWVVLYTDPRRRVSSWYYVLGAYASWIALHPPFFRYGWYPPFVMGAIFFLAWIPFAPLLKGISRLSLPRTLTVPVAWVTVEWFRATVTLAHFDLYRLGAFQAKFPLLIQIVDITGVYGLTFLVAAVNGLFADLWFAARERGSLRAALAARPIRRSLLAVAGMLVVVVSYGAYRLEPPRPATGPALAIVQPNVRHTLANVARVQLTQLMLTQREIPPGQVDLIVWPENAILDILVRSPAYLDDLAWLAAGKDADLLVGAMGPVEGDAGRSTNTAFLLGRNGQVLGTYDKQLLFPWSEFVPFDGLLARLAPTVQRLHRRISRLAWGTLANGIHGTGPVLFSLPWEGGELPFSALICIENIYPPLPSAAARLGARFFVNITSEGEVGGPSQEQLLRTCILRAVENRIPYVRAGNTGISVFIDAHGRVQSLLRGEGGRVINVPGVLVDRVGLSDGGTTIYARSRDAFALSCVVATLVMLGLGLTRRSPGPPPEERRSQAPPRSPGRPAP